MKLDFLFIRMQDDVTRFYKEKYAGSDRKCRLLLHLHMLEMLYKPELFKEKSNKEMRENKKRLLTKVQNVVDEWLLM